MVRAAVLWILLCGLAALPARAETEPAAYALDELSRTVPTRGRLPCPTGLVRYRGTHIRYHKPVRVHPAFVPVLARFEAIAVEVAVEHYGRAPRRLVHIGAYNCRRTRGYPDLLSEHALGNALDVEAFRFGRARRGAELPDKAPRRAFSVSVERHWDGAGRHAAFLRALTERLQKDDVFRVMLGPAYPGHDDHFHFDMAPYRLVSL